MLAVARLPQNALANEKKMVESGRSGLQVCRQKADPRQHAEAELTSASLKTATGRGEMCV